MRRCSSFLSAVKVLVAGSITSILTISLLPSPAFANPADIPFSEQKILEMHNAERAARGIRPLVADSRLQQFAEQWAWTLAGEGRIYHVDTLPARGLGFKAGGENIVYRTPSMTAEYAHMEWMKSDLHRKNLLDPAFSHAGVGISCATVNGRNYTVAVVEFGADAKPSTSVPPLDPRAITGDEYAGRPVTCHGFARPAAPSGIVALPPAPAAATVTAPPAAKPKPASVPPAPKPAAALVLVDVPPPGPPAVLPPTAPPAPVAEVTTTLPQAQPPAAPDPEPQAAEQAVEQSEPGEQAVEQSETPAHTVTTASPQLDGTAPVSNRQEMKLFSGLFFLMSLMAWLSSGYVTSRKMRRIRAAAAEGYTQGSGEKSWWPRLGWQR